jgi:hypothetical protein
MDRSTSQTRSEAHQPRRKLGGQQPGGRAGGQHHAGPPGASARCCAAWAWSRWLRSRAPWSLVSARAPDGGSRAARIRRPGRGAALPGQLPHDVAVGRAEVGVGLQPPGPALLMLAQRQFRLGGPVGLLASHHHHHHRVRSDAGRRLLPAQAKHPRTLPLGAVAGGGELLQGLVGLDPAGRRPLQLQGPIPRGLVEQPLEPVTLGLQLPGGQPPQVPGCWGCRSPRSG